MLYSIFIHYNINIFNTFSSQNIALFSRKKYNKTMKINYDKQKLEKTIGTFFILTGISIAVLDTEYNFVCSSTKQNDFCTCMQSNGIGKVRCKMSDEKLIRKCKESRRFESHICHAGLYDAVIPIIKSDVIVGYVIMGRVRAESSPKTVRGNVSVRLKKLYDELPYFDNAQIDSIKTLVEEIIFESAITIDVDETTDKIAGFLKENITQKFSISELCARFCVSKANLYDGFLKSFGMTVNGFVIHERIERAKELLTKTAMPVYQVGQQVGIDNYTYFCRLFKKRTGFTPKTYRNKNA